MCILLKIPQYNTYHLVEHAFYGDATPSRVQEVFN